MVILKSMWEVMKKYPYAYKVKQAGKNKVLVWPTFADYVEWRDNQ